ncbi:hypothetical protein EBB07_14145 [Paenibacillaceae bacterium]|nr:hypothetical protein EBB07_14145 [Paenibacillaceae bacterium]
MKKIVIPLLVALLCLSIAPAPKDQHSAIKEELQGPYTDWLQQELDFGQTSYYLAPWRSYMDTWGVDRYSEALGVVFNVGVKEAEATAQVLSEAGIRSARIEIGWDSISYEDGTKMRADTLQNMTAMLTALKKYHIRPLILLNANSGGPGPSKLWEVELTEPAKAGAKEIYINDTTGIKPKYTGLRGIAQLMYPVITAVDAKQGKLTLSAPLPKALPKGKLSLARLNYQPFAGEVFEDGTENPAAWETVNGWLQYVGTVTKTVKGILGTNGKSDAGFDVEVWNELSFGSQFLDIGNYYSPKLVFSRNLTYTSNGRKQEGFEVILPLTADYVKDPANGLPNVRVISGFSNQRPWDSGSSVWPNQDGYSRHYYTGWDPAKAYINPSRKDLNISKLLNAEAQLETTSFLPTHSIANPESWFYANQTETVARDTQPFPGPWRGHHRYANAGDGREAELWMTEVNFYRGLFSKDLLKRTGISLQDERHAKVMQHIGAKATLRSYLFYGHKGIQTLMLYAAKGEDGGFAMLPERFYKALAENGYKLTTAVRAEIGPQLAAVKNTTKLLANSEYIATSRPLTVSKLVEYDPRLVFSGNSTPGGPDRYQRDDFAVLPFQLDARRFAVAYYVVTRDLTKVWDEKAGPLAAGGYDMPPQTYELSLSNIVGEGATVYAYDPVTDTRQAVSVLGRSATELTVRLQATDSPRFLIIEEKDVQPLIIDPKLASAGDKGGGVFQFTSNVDGDAVITWGTYPFRTKGSFKEERFAMELQRGEAEVKAVDKIDFDRLRKEKGSYRWSGTIKPQFSENYTFIISSDTCYHQLFIDGEKVIDGCGQQKRGAIELVAGREYQLTVGYSTPYLNEGHFMTLFWASDSQPREAVAPVAAQEQIMSMQVARGQKVELPLLDLWVGDGVKLRLSKNGIYTEFPRWNYDLQGVASYPDKRLQSAEHR